MRRREFLGTSAFLLFDARVAAARASQAPATPRGPDLREELSAVEMEIVDKSVMARDLDNYFGKGFS